MIYNHHSNSSLHQKQTVSLDTIEEESNWVGLLGWNDCEFGTKEVGRDLARILYPMNQVISVYRRREFEREAEVQSMPIGGYLALDG